MTCGQTLLGQGSGSSEMPLACARARRPICPAPSRRPPGNVFLRQRVSAVAGGMCVSGYGESSCLQLCAACGPGLGGWDTAGPGPVPAEDSRVDGMARLWPQVRDFAPLLSAFPADSRADGVLATFYRVTWTCPQGHWRPVLSPQEVGVPSPSHLPPETPLPLPQASCLEQGKRSCRLMGQFGDGVGLPAQPAS